jgi:putative aldouronate transport system substrate-binding protein
MVHRRLLALALTALVATATAFGAAQTDAATGDEVMVTPPGTLPIVEEKITLRVGAIPISSVIDLNTNYATGWMEEQTNIHVEWDVFPSKDAKEKINLLLASGSDLPEVFLGSRVLSPEQLMLYGGQGLFRPLDDYLAEQAFYITEFFEEFPLLKKIATMPDGNIYAMGRFELCYHCYTAQKVWYNKTWLDTLGLAVPETTEELYQVLKAFKEQDPNGNGKADEVPFSAATNSWHTYVDGFLMNPFVYNDGEDRLVLDNGTVSAAFTTPEWRDGLRYMNRLVSEGLLDRESFIQDRNQRMQMVEGETIVLGMAPAGHPGVFSQLRGEPTKNYRALPPVRGPKGIRQATYYPPEHRFGVDYRFAITRVAENPVAAFRWVDYMFSEDALLHLYFGEENVDWAYAKPGELGVDGEPAWFNDGKAAGSGLSGVHTMSQQNQMWGHMGPRYCTWGCIQSRVTDPNDPWYIEKRLYDATKAFYDPYKRDLAKIVPPVTIELDEVSEYVELKTTINEFVKEHIALFVTGNLDLDADWDSYLATLDQIGIDRYLELVQSAYDRTYR